MNQPTFYVNALRLLSLSFCPASAALIRRLVGPPRCTVLSSGVEKTPAIRVSEHVLQHMTLDEKSRLSALGCWTAMDAIHWLL